jgi:hypothetical protein
MLAGPHVGEIPRQRSEYFRRAGKAPLVSPVLARVLPEPLGRSELRRSGRQLMQFQPVTVQAEPCPRLAFLVALSADLNEQRALALVAVGQPLQKCKWGRFEEENQ